MVGIGEYDLELSSTKQNLQQVKDADKLEHLGYKQELKRSLGFWSMVGFSFSILSCWSAMAGSLASSMLNGGPAVLIWGWLGCCAFSLFVALCMADMCSAYPVAGGQYSWCLMLAKGTKWGRAVSFACGWIQMGGLVAMTAVSAYLPANSLAAFAQLNFPDYTIEDWHVALIALGCLIFHLMVSMFGVKIISPISTTALWWSIGGFIICTVVTLARSPSFQPPSFVFSSTIYNQGGWPGQNMAIVLGIMQPAFGIATYDSVAHLSEETEDAEKQCPRALVMSVLIGFVTCFAFLIAVLFCVQDLDAVVNTPTGVPILEIFYQATNNKAAATCLGVVIYGTQIFSGISLITETSRSVYAFARDGAFPKYTNEYLMKVSKTLDVPVIAMLFVCVIAAGLICILFGSSTAFFTVMDIATTGLYISYFMCVAVFMVRRKHKIAGYYNLGKWALWCQIPACLYLFFCIIFMFFPTTIPVDAGNMNYNCAAIGIIAILAVISWFCGAKTSFIETIESLEPSGVVEAIDVPDYSESNSVEKK